MNDVATLQALLVAGVLGIAGVVKLLDRSRRNTFRDSPLLHLLGTEPRVVRAVQSLAAVEVGLALAIVTLANTAVPRIGAAVLLFGSTIYLVWARRVAPEAPCGCFGSLSNTPISTRTLARAMLLTVAAFAAAAAETPMSVPTAPGPWAVFGAEVIVVAALSPELSLAKRWLVVGRKLPRCLYSNEDPGTTLKRLRACPVWSQLLPHLAAPSPDDQWLESCWRLFSFPAVHAGNSVAAVVAVKLPPEKPSYRAALVDEKTRQVLARLDANGTRWRPVSVPPQRIATAQ